MRNHSYDNDFDLHENEIACRSHFHLKGFELRLILKQRHKRTRKWPIDFYSRKILHVLSELVVPENIHTHCKEDLYRKFHRAGGLKCQNL